MNCKYHRIIKRLKLQETNSYRSSFDLYSASARSLPSSVDSSCPWVFWLAFWPFVKLQPYYVSPVSCICLVFPDRQRWNIILNVFMNIQANMPVNIVNSKRYYPNIWPFTLTPYIPKKSSTHAKNATFLATQKEIWRPMLKLFIWNWNHINVPYALNHLLEKMNWKNIDPQLVTKINDPLILILICK